VLQFGSYFDKFGADSKQYQSIYDNNDTYYLAGHYNPRLQVLKLQDDIPTLRPPDVYSITLDGERGNKSHVMSREDILKDTVSGHR